MDIVCRFFLFGKMNKWFLKNFLFLFKRKGGLKIFKSFCDYNDGLMYLVVYLGLESWVWKVKNC